jgi:cell division protein FtsN
MLTAAAQDNAPHDVTFYLRDLAASYHSYYDAERILVDDEAVKRARLALIAATAQVLHNGLAVLGVSAPNRRCERQDETSTTWRHLSGHHHRRGDRAGRRLGRGHLRDQGARALHEQAAAAPAAAAASASAKGARPADNPPAAAAPPKPAAAATGADPLGDLAKSKSGATADPFTYLVQAGAFRTPEDAEAQRAKLSLMGVEAKVTEREQSGRTVYRVRVGPFDNKEAADRMKERIDAGGMESTLVRVQR